MERGDVTHFNPQPTAPLRFTGAANRWRRRGFYRVYFPARTPRRARLRPYCQFARLCSVHLRSGNLSGRVEGWREGGGGLWLVRERGLWLVRERGLRIFHLPTLLHFKVPPLYLEITDSASQTENKRGALRFEEIDTPPTTTTAAAAATSPPPHPPKDGCQPVAMPPRLVGGCVFL